jgi:hypothetical protein
MGILDKIKGLLGGKKAEVSKGLDAAAKFVKDKAPDSMDGKIDAGVEQAKKAADKL